MQKNKTEIKILHLISSLSRGGRERQIAGILRNSKHKAIVFNIAHNSYVQEYNLEEKVIYLKTKNSFPRFIEMFRIVQKEKPVILWSWGGFEATFGLLLSLLTPARHINGSIRHGITLFRRKHLWRMFILHLSRHIVANSHAGLKANRLKRGNVLYNGLDNRFFENDDQEVFLSEDPDIKQIKDRAVPVLISVANLVPYKDYFTVLNALEKLKKDGIAFSYLIIGEGSNRQTIEQQIIDKGLLNDVFLLGQRQDVKTLLSISDVFIHSSIGEGCSNAILEAMSVGLTIIATDTGGTPEIVDKSFGRLFEYKNWQQLYQYLEWFHSNPQKMKEMGLKARKIAKQNFSVEKMIIEYEQIIQQVANKK